MQWLPCLWHWLRNPHYYLWKILIWMKMLTGLFAEGEPRARFPFFPEKKISEESLQTPEILVKSKRHSLISVAESNKRQYRLSHGWISFLSARSWKPFSAAQPWSGLSFQRNLLRLCVKEKSVSNRRGRSVLRAPVSHRTFPALHWQSLPGCLALFHHHHNPRWWKGFVHQHHALPLSSQPFLCSQRLLGMEMDKSSVCTLLCLVWEDEFSHQLSQHVLGKG